MVRVQKGPQLETCWRRAGHRPAGTEPSANLHGGDLRVEPLDLLAELHPKKGLVGILLRLEASQVQQGGRGHLLGGIQDGGEKPVSEGLWHSDSLRGVEPQHPLEHALGLLCHVFELGPQPVALARLEASQVPPRVRALLLRDLLLGRRAQDVEDHVQLVIAAGVEVAVPLVLRIRRHREARASREQRPAVAGPRALQHAEQLRVDAACRPDVDRLRVVVLKQNQLRCTVPSGNDVRCEVPFQEAVGVGS
mmetsp:Transcript_41843/g.94441  ORF Transcript_41843/g.94441 Transcript_41843/m.94441 type:complete len:250 (+) Transcript_41843:99-848(+)